MWYLVEHILLCLFIAALIGAAIGWILHSQSVATRIADLEAMREKWSIRSNLDLTRERGEMEIKDALANQALLETHTLLRELSARIHSLEDEISALNQKRAELESSPSLGMATLAAFTNNETSGDVRVHEEQRSRITEGSSRETYRDETWQELGYDCIWCRLGMRLQHAHFPSSGPKPPVRFVP